jgi:hypothetical protein
VQVGYCPQRDPLLELLTPREHLQLYARIKGVPEKNLLLVVGVKLRVSDRSGFFGCVVLSFGYFCYYLLLEVLCTIYLAVQW